mmetsp:Transcript_109341/g.172314  ORF Transcript_109341/g.172314 Transcript_109341/m.172314 type:complete len:234 (-) Transcript_109341:83-784(-)
MIYDLVPLAKSIVNAKPKRPTLHQHAEHPCFPSCVGKESALKAHPYNVERPCGKVTCKSIDFLRWEPRHRLEHILRRSSDREGDWPKQGLINHIGRICVATLVVNDVACKTSQVNCSQNCGEGGKYLQIVSVSMQGADKTDWKSDNTKKRSQWLPDMLSRPCEATTCENLVTFHSVASLLWQRVPPNHLVVEGPVQNPAPNSGNTYERHNQAEQKYEDTPADASKRSTIRMAF